MGGHFILGLPGETDDMLLAQTARINALPLTTVKFHQLQVFRGTAMAAEYDAPGSIPFLEPRRIPRSLCGDSAAAASGSGRRTLRLGGSAALPLRPQLGPGAQRTTAVDAGKRLERRNAYQGEIFTTFVDE